MTEVLLLVLAVVVVVGLLVMVRNANRLFFLRVKDGVVVAAKGQIPPALLQQVQDVVESRPVTAADLRVERSGGQPIWRVSGDVTEVERQRLRNVLGMWPIAKIRNAPRGGTRLLKKSARRNPGHLRRIK